jgi:hypothetical protein
MLRARHLMQRPLVVASAATSAASKSIALPALGCSGGVQPAHYCCAGCVLGSDSELRTTDTATAGVAAAAASLRSLLFLLQQAGWRPPLHA